MKPAIEVVIEEPAWRTAEPRVRSLVKAAAAATLKAEGQAAGTVAILLAADARLQALNLAFRGKPTATNVLSFPGAGEHLGDIALALGVCACEAAEQGKSLAHHLQHLTTHGVLHLLRYDHETDAEAEVMEAKERQILAGLGIADPYAAERGRPEGDHGRHHP
jgi:probable rRNA maturation factor